MKRLKKEEIMNKAELVTTKIDRWKEWKLKMALWTAKFLKWAFRGFVILANLGVLAIVAMSIWTGNMAEGVAFLLLSWVSTACACEAESNCAHLFDQYLSWLQSRF